MTLTKAQRTRVRRVINTLRIPLNQLEKDKLYKYFSLEIVDLRRLRAKIRARAIELGYDPDEDLGIEAKPLL